MGCKDLGRHLTFLKVSKGKGSRDVLKGEDNEKIEIPSYISGAKVIKIQTLNNRDTSIEKNRIYFIDFIKEV